MRTRMGRRGLAMVAGTMVVAAPVAAACSQGPTFEDWAATDGAAGRINLDEVQKAFQKSQDASEFEQRVNEIYEGDGLVLIRASQDGETLVLEGFEDLNSNSEIDDTADDLLFSIVKDHDNHEMRGHGANGYYRSGFGGGNFLFTYMLISALSPRGYYYQTPRGTVGRMRAQRSSYRSTSGYRSQVSRNSSFFGSQKKFAGSRYDSASRNLSTGRQSYQSNSNKSGSFKRSSTGVRSSWGSRGTGSGFGRASSRGGGFRGFGGAQTIIGLRRH